jgi:hypothetical protein
VQNFAWTSLHSSYQVTLEWLRSCREGAPAGAAIVSGPNHRRSQPISWTNKVARASLHIFKMNTSVIVLGENGNVFH